MSRQFSFAVLIIVVIASFFMVKKQDEVTRPFDTGGVVKIKEISKNKSLYQLEAGPYLIKTFHLDPSIQAGDAIYFQGRQVDVRDRDQAYYSESYSKYLLSKKIYYQVEAKELELVSKGRNLYSLRYKIREFLSQTVEVLYKKEAPIIKALTYGDKNEITKEQNRTFSITGTSHVLALSGFHVGIVGGLINIGLGRFSVKNRGFFTICFLVLYAFITGLRASILRAVGFFILYYLAFAKKERYNLFSAAAMMAALLLAINPYYIYDLGFVLSFAGVFSIACFYPLVKDLLSGYKFSETKLGKAAMLTLAAQVLTQPLVAYYFGILSMVSLASNLLVVPVISLLMPLSLASISIHLLSRGLPILIPIDLGLVASVKLVHKILIASTEFFAKIPYSYLELEISRGQLIWTYLGLLGLYLAWEIKMIRENKYEFKRDRTTVREGQ